MAWREGEGSKRAERIADWVSWGRVGRVAAGGRGVGGSMVFFDWKGGCSFVIVWWLRWWW